MSDNPITSVVGATVRIGSDVLRLADERGPIITFETAPTFGHILGLIDISLVVSRSVPGPGQPTREAVVVANLRCTQAGAADLRDALNGALLMLQPVEKPDGPAN